MKCDVWSDQGDDFRRLFSYKKNRKRVNGDELEGLTVQLGSRQSDTICRFYDKKPNRFRKVRSFRRAVLPGRAVNLNSRTAMQCACLLRLP